MSRAAPLILAFLLSLGGAAALTGGSLLKFCSGARCLGYPLTTGTRNAWVTDGNSSPHLVQYVEDQCPACATVWRADSVVVGALVYVGRRCPRCCHSFASCEAAARALSGYDTPAVWALPDPVNAYPTDCGVYVTPSGQTTAAVNLVCPTCYTPWTRSSTAGTVFADYLPDGAELCTCASACWPVASDAPALRDPNVERTPATTGYGQVCPPPACREPR